MSKSFDLSSFFYGTELFQLPPDFYDIRLFHLHGLVDNDFSTDGSKCRIRVSPRRFLDVRIYPDLFSVSFWAMNSHHTIKSGFHSAVELKKNENGYLFDAWDFLLSNEIMVEPCHTDDWRSSRKYFYHNENIILNSSTNGLADFSVNEYDDVQCVNTFYYPKTFTIFEHDIQEFVVAVPYNGPQESDHDCEKEREHGKI